MTILPFLLLALGTACVVLFYRNHHVTKRLSEINDTLVELRSGTFNQRFRVHTTDVELKQLCGNLNNLIDQIQNTFERAQYLEESRKKMISNISHDLRTPLTSLLGYVEALQTDDHLTEEERIQYLDIIARKGNRLTELFQAFFELSKLESNDARLKVQKVNLTAKAQEVLLTFYQEITHAGLTPELDLPEQALHAYGDGDAIERVLNNLISNALRYGASGGVIGLALREEAEVIRIEVWDRGQGIHPDDLPYIFERLYTGERSRNSQLQGNGIGLTITKQLVEKMRGRIEVHSVPGEQTMFSITLPKCF